jgi:chemotaxis protein methyltransferase CheR
MGKPMDGLEYNAFRQFLSENSGIILGEDKAYLVMSRITSILDRHHLNSVGELIAGIKNDKSMMLGAEVVDAMTTNETNWFRDVHPFQVLKQLIFPEMSKSLKNEPLKIWSTACSSGQEPYTISMTLSEYLMTNPGVLKGGVQILATDISHTMLEQAKSGEYDDLAMARGMSTERMYHFFETLPSGKKKIKKHEADRVSFRALNLLDNYILLGKFHVIFCRNVLIYFSSEVKQGILKRLVENLHPQGYLFLGASESIGQDCDSLEMVKCNPGLVYRKK